MQDAVIVGAVRTAFGRRRGALTDQHPVDLSAMVLDALVDRAGIDPADVDDVVWGCVTQSGDQAGNVARYAVLAAGWPEHVPGTTVTRACGSSQQAVDFAAQAIACGRQDVVVAGGVEAMSRVPIGSNRQDGTVYGPRMLARYPNQEINQGLGAEMIAAKYELTRTSVDEYAAVSHQRAAAAIESGAFADQIVPVELADGVRFDVDEGVRPETTAATLAVLKPAFKEDGVIHAGNSSQISDGASAILLMSLARANRYGLRPIARVHSSAVIGADPITMLEGPIPATEKLMKRSGVRLDEIGVFEVNEAFAPIPMAWMSAFDVPVEKVNPLGGAIAMGHPLGASGTALMGRLISYMTANRIHFGLQTMCEGGGTANATLVELL